MSDNQTEIDRLRAYVKRVADHFEASGIVGPLWQEAQKLLRVSDEQPKAPDMSDNQAAKHVHDVLTAIAEGYPVRGEDDRFVVVENPRYAPDDGSDPNLVIDVHALAVLFPLGREWVMVPKAAMDWLMGEGTDDSGHWFHDDDRDDPESVFRRRYWWRSKFRAMIEASHLPVQIEVLRQDIAWYIQRVVHLRDEIDRLQQERDRLREDFRVLDETHGHTIGDLNEVIAERDSLKAELDAYRDAADYDAMMEGPRFKGWDLSQLNRARRITEAARSALTGKEDSRCS